MVVGTSLQRKSLMGGGDPVSESGDFRRFLKHPFYQGSAENQGFSCLR